MKIRMVLGFVIIGMIAGGLVGCQRADDSTPSRTAIPDKFIEHASSTPDRATPTSTRTPRPSATATIRPTRTPTPTATLPPAEWTNLGAGISERFIPVNLPNAIGEVYVYALRLDPSAVAIQVFYDREEPKTIGDWQEATGAQIVVNGGFFSGAYTPVGRIVVDGTLYGFPLQYPPDSVGVPGMMTVIDGEVDIWGLGRSALSPQGMRFDYAIESYPLLVLPGGQPTFPEETGRLARRTVVGLDREGNLIILFAQSPVFSLHTLSEFLARPEVELDIALNLDGGRSSGLVVNHGGIYRHFESVVPLPIVLGIYTRGN